MKALKLCGKSARSSQTPHISGPHGHPLCTQVSERKCTRPATGRNAQTESYLPRSGMKYQEKLQVKVQQAVKCYFLVRSISQTPSDQPRSFAAHNGFNSDTVMNTAWLNERKKKYLTELHKIPEICHRTPVLWKTFRVFID